MYECGYGLSDAYQSRRWLGLKIKFEMGAVTCNVPKFVFCMCAAVFRVFFLAVVGRVFFFASKSSLIDVGAVACKVPNFVLVWLRVVLAAVVGFLCFSCVFFSREGDAFRKFLLTSLPMKF